MHKKPREYSSWHHMMEKMDKGSYVESFLQKFENFYEAMGDRPEEKTLSLIDPSKGYVRGNLVWGAKRKQKPRSCKIGNRKREHNSWKNMIVRTYYPSHERQKEYAKIGCYVEKYLQDFENFYSYMGPRPEGKTLDRIDPWGPYIRGNIRWASVSEQNLNTRKQKPRQKQLSFSWCAPESRKMPVPRRRKKRAA